MKKTKMLALVLSLALMVCTMIPAVSAADKPQAHIPGEGEGTVSPMMYCENCEIGETASTCLREHIFLDSGYHDPWFGPKCRIDLYISRSVEMCTACHHIVERSENAPGGNGRGNHDCWEEHETCSKGNYHVCPCQIK